MKMSREKLIENARKNNEVEELEKLVSQFNSSKEIHLNIFFDSQYEDHFTCNSKSKDFLINLFKEGITKRIEELREDLYLNGVDTHI